MVLLHNYFGVNPYFFFLFFFFFQNTFGPGAQAVALRVSGDRAAFYACRFISFQDTVLDDAGRHYYKNCYIEGATDVICGDGKALFEVKRALD